MNKPHMDIYIANKFHYINNILWDIINIVNFNSINNLDDKNYNFLLFNYIKIHLSINCIMYNFILFVISVALYVILSILYLKYLINIIEFYFLFIIVINLLLYLCIIYYFILFCLILILYLAYFRMLLI
jgi:hypothetical protein